MNHETAIKRIQSLVPDVMKLEFGCKLRGLWYENGSPNEFYTDAVYVAKTKICYHLLLENKTYGMVLINDFEDRFTILGKTITLAVILSAIDDESLVIEAKTGQFGTTTAEGVYVGEHAIWNLSKDNFNDQSEETKTFIGELLK